MPIYEYRCPNGHTFELFQRMADAPAESCELCGAGPVEKILFPVAVHFKGSGFYSTDYGKGSRKAKDGESGTKDGGSGSTAEKSSDASPSTPEKSPGSSEKSSGDKGSSASGSSGSS